MGRIRKSIPLSLDISKPDQMGLFRWISYLKKRGEFAPTFRRAMRIMYLISRRDWNLLGEELPEFREYILAQSQSDEVAGIRASLDDLNKRLNEVEGISLRAPIVNNSRVGIWDPEAMR